MSVSQVKNGATAPSTSTSSPSNEVKIEDENNRDNMCGLGSWRPARLQFFTDPLFFMINFSIVAVIQGSYFSYLIGCSSTLEKRFSYSSRLTGFILIADNFSQILISPFIGFLGKRMNKATLIASGMVFVSFSCWLTAVPYFIYGPGHLQTVKREIELCGLRSDEICTDSNSQSTTVWPAYILIWLASFLNGIGYTAFYTLGFPYVDDNVPKHNAPIYFSVLSALRLLGPTTGFLMVSLCLSMNEDPFAEIKLAQTDPRFIGAWWLGFIIIGSFIFISSLPLFLFPKNLKSSRIDKKVLASDGEGKGLVAKFNEAKTSLWRVLKNPVWAFDTCAGTFRFIGYAGYYITQPKYIESQYKKSASSASFATGMYSVVAMAMGIMGGGVFISRMRPGPKLLTSLIFGVELFANAGIISGLFFGCPKSTYFGLDTNLLAPCNTDCSCSRRVLQPYCSSDGKTNYFSPCFAGCRSSPLFLLNQTLDNCACESTLSSVTSAINLSPSLSSSSSLKRGPCPVECDNFTKYITFLSIGKFISSTSRTGNFIVRFRSVEERDKSFAMGIGMTIFGTFGSIPYPLIFGAVADAACTIWEEGCGGRGSCWAYDSDKFRTYLHLASAAFMTIGSTFDLFVIFFSHRMQNLYDDSDTQRTEEREKRKKSDSLSSGDVGTLKQGKLEFKAIEDSSETTSNREDIKSGEETTVL